MKGDFSRQAFDRKKHYRKVLMQQGRVQLDSDWKEQADTTLHFLQAFVEDLIGHHGGTPDGFRISGSLGNKDLRNDFTIHAGRYYVGGMLCENERNLTYATQPDFPLPSSQQLQKGGRYLVYLDVWERAVTYLDDPNLPDVALDGTDTAARTKVVWQVKVLRRAAEKWSKRATSAEKLLNELTARRDLPTVVPPQGGYTGLENQLYRVEIHDPGRAPADSGRPTFKWSRDNGSVVAPIVKVGGDVVTVGAWAGREGIPISPGICVELTDDIRELQGLAGSLRLVKSVSPRRMELKLDRPSPQDIANHLQKHALVRRWDQSAKLSDEGAVSIEPGRWVKLENGIRVKFSSGTYRTGDYWLIPARASTGDIKWPTSRGKLVPLPPHGIIHHCAPLAFLSLDHSGKPAGIEDLRAIIKRRTTRRNGDGHSGRMARSVQRG